MTNRTTRSHRLFYALWPDNRTRDALMELQVPLQGRKARVANLHLTLAFLGQQPHERLPELKNILAELPRISIPMVVNRMGYFTRNKIAWAGMHATPSELISLQRDLVQALIQSKIAFDSGATFCPHITLARDAQPPEDLPFPPITWEAKQIVLVESTSRQDGVLYRVLASQEMHFSDVNPADLPNEIS